MNRLASLGLLVCSVLVLGACSEDTAVPSQQVLGASEGLVSLNGTWRAEQCTGLDDNSDQRTTLRFSGSAFTNTRHEYAAGDDCEGDVRAERLITATATIGDKYSLHFGAANVIGSKADFALISVLRTVYTEAVAEEFNAGMVCGFGDWAAGEPREVIASEAEGCVFTIAQSTSLFIDDEAEPQRLYAANAVATGEDYPRNLLDTYPYARQ